LYLNSLDGMQMNESLEALKKVIDECSQEERKELFQFLRARLPLHPLEIEWAIDGDDVLSSLYRATDLSKRGVRGLIAEFVFERDVLPSVRENGWKLVSIPKGDWPYDSLVERDGKQASIQIKLQRLEAGHPKRFWEKTYKDLVYYDVEVQKTRTGKKRSPKGSAPSVEQQALPNSIDTRPYPFGAFDILAVNMQPATKKWSEFRFTVANWLLERPDSPSLIEIHQPVALIPDNAWTDNLSTCLEWFLRGEDKKILEEIRHKPRPRKKNGSSS
jgi:hypothetical protein